MYLDRTLNELHEETRRIADRDTLGDEVTGIEEEIKYHMFRGLDTNWRDSSWAFDALN